MIEQKLCTWLLQRLDRCPDTEITITQDLIADALGVRREGINEAAMKLQLRGLILCRRGHITVLNRALLENMTCECYGVVKKMFNRLLPKPKPHPFADRPAWAQVPPNHLSVQRPLTLNWNQTAVGSNENRAQMSGAGIGLAWSGTQQFFVKAQLAKVLGTPSASLASVTGSVRGWLEIAHAF